MFSALNQVTFAWNLRPPTHITFWPAQGWLELCDSASAVDELERIAPENRAHPEVLCVRWEIHRIEKKWEAAIELARAITQIAPERFEGWWMLSFALHELDRTQEAYDNLKSVRGKFATESLLHYNLACYLARMGRVDEARGSLKTAFTLNPEMRAGAREDKDLEPLWHELRGT